MKELKDTVDLMLSDDPRDRFKAEYWQTKIRFDRLNKTILEYDNDAKSSAPPCPSRETLLLQGMRMASYLSLLRLRAKMEGIDIADHEPETEVKTGAKIRIRSDLKAASGIIPEGTVAIVALVAKDELMLFFPDYLVNSDTKLLRIFRSEIGSGKYYEVMTDAQ